MSDDTLSCGQTKSHDLDDGVMFNADGACGSQNNGLAVTLEFVAGCDGVVEVSLDADPNDIMVITRLEGICSSRAWCRRA